MDKAYSIGINILLRRLSIQRLLDTSQSIYTFHVEDVCEKEDFVRECLSEYTMYSDSECENIYKDFCDKAVKCDHGLFSLFSELSGQVLRIDRDEVRCIHSELLSWRETIHAIGQSIFICAFLASKDEEMRCERFNFDFSPYAKTDYLRLRNMLSEGMAENHFHLKGSAPAFLMSWVCLMNHIYGRNTKQGFQHKDMKELFFRPPVGDEDLSLCETVQIAAYIRYHLNQWLDGNRGDELSANVLNRKPHTWIPKLQRQINVGRRIGGGGLDYSLNTKISTGAYAPLAGEHYFLYRMFRAIYGRKPDADRYRIYFLIYLLAFVRFRAELVQSNKAVGFQNFLAYQNRKDIFLESYPAYREAFVKMALQSTLSNKAIKSLEARFVPSEKYVKLKKDIKKFSKHSIPEAVSPWEKKFKKDKSLFFVAHLVKMPDMQRARASGRILSRHHTLRQTCYAKQIQNIIRLRKTCGDCAATLYGIDACNEEHYARPEVFAYLFRQARHANNRTSGAAIKDKPLPRLMVTYHVGEDFFDITSGLRAIDEAITFLDLHHGDRLGHALALGIEPQIYYASKNQRLFIPRQELIDNMAWLGVTLRKYGLFERSLETWIHQLYREQFLYLYRSEGVFAEKDRLVSMETYVDAWYLRGDHPKYYKNVAQHKMFETSLLFAKPYELLKGERYEAIRYSNIQARQLIWHYHYDENVRQKGAEIYELEIPQTYALVIRALQDAMLQEICHNGIAIETNPSSNYLIGTFRQYHTHPIVRFYDRGLTMPETSPHAFVSINTDDQGIFDTDLENEYALMACALQNAKDKNGENLYTASNIIYWLDHVRKMGLEQSALLTHKNLLEV